VAKAAVAKGGICRGVFQGMFSSPGLRPRVEAAGVLFKPCVDFRKAARC